MCEYGVLRMYVCMYLYVYACIFVGVGCRFSVLEKLLDLDMDNMYRVPSCTS